MMDLFEAVEIEINHHCNRRCGYCPNHHSVRKSNGEINPELYGRLLAELSELSFKGRVSFHFYNEPMLHSDLLGIVRQARSHLPLAKLVLYTNGSLLTNSWFENLLSAGIDQFIVTRHAQDDNRDDYVFERTWQKLDGNQRSRVIYISHQQLAKTDRAGTLDTVKMPKVGNLPCLIPSKIITVTVSGGVLPCFEDYNETQLMGHLSDSSLLEIWKSPQFVQFRKSLKLGMRNQNNLCSKCHRSQVLDPF